MKIAVCVFLSALLAVGWFNAFSALNMESGDYDVLISSAEDSRDRELYDQAVEFYKEAHDIKPSTDIWQEIKNAHEAHLAIEVTDLTLRNYISDMKAAAAEYRTERDFWMTLLELQDKSGWEKDRYETAVQALRALGSDEDIKQIAEELYHITRLDYHVWESLLDPLTGYVTVSDESNFYLLENNEPISSGYEYIGQANTEGYAVYKTGRGFRLKDSEGIDRAVYPEISAAGIYSGGSGLVPLMTSGKWRYYSVGGEALPDEYDTAGTFANGSAAVNKDGKWFLINEQGEKITELPFEEIKLSPAGALVQNGIILGKNGGVWNLYDDEYKQTGGIGADEMDSYAGDEYTAFKKGNEWGFTDAKGNEVIQPNYIEAKSFSNGLGAVKNSGGLWGFINADNELVIDYQFNDVSYFADDRTCYVRTESGWQFLSFVIN